MAFILAASPTARRHPGDVDGLHESLHQIGDGMGGSGFYFAADDSGQEAAEGGAEIAGGKVLAGEEIG